MTKFVVNARPCDQSIDMSAPPTDAALGSRVSLTAIGRAFGVTYGPSVLLTCSSG
jgi:hypothetical protein